MADNNDDETMLPLVNALMNSASEYTAYQATLWLRAEAWAGDDLCNGMGALIDGDEDE